MTSGWARDKVVELAKAILDGEVNLVEGCRAIVPLLHDLDPAVRDSDWALDLVAVESETDEFPVGSQRQHWAPAILAAKDQELEAYLDEVRTDVEEACRALVALLQNP